MKIIVAGSTGFVATEVIRQALSIPAITSVVALARRTTAVPQNAGPSADASKLKSVVCDDFENYTETVKKELVGADACIWLIAVTFSNVKTMPFEDVRKICLDYTLKGMETMAQLPRDSASNPLRFIYTSGHGAQRDQSQKPWIQGDYTLMRGKTESLILEFAKNSNGAVEACVTKPGIIDAPGRTGPVMKVLGSIGRAIISLPILDVGEIAATLLQQAVNGIEKDTLLHEDLVRIGQKALAAENIAR
ncbi:hypothetical protein VE01_07236 [Pseudogymnoascus verrucosus]|uniref:NAD(P)-binding domain-containing protein n=1 Tax=Pseudogymnoascus verrucosus TaxID=342668 RepID=A0A1B8GF62_9PEZI|nr:uncharacterized protein VE01_07236 [Pseudogymnoascus verrucosus]OBT94457.1 hypothetical protein VE01_07236 [Pseudogymnoascus verrucosus]